MLLGRGRPGSSGLTSTKTSLDLSAGPCARERWQSSRSSTRCRCLGSWEHPTSFWDPSSRCASVSACHVTRSSRAEIVFAGHSERPPLIRVHATHWFDGSELQYINADSHKLPWLGLNTDPALPKAWMELVTARRLAGKRTCNQPVCVNEHEFVVPNTMQAAGAHGAVVT